MTEHTPEFLALFQDRFDLSRCCNSRWTGYLSMPQQCKRKNGHGPHGAYCKQHDPAAAKARHEARHAKWREEVAALQAEAKAAKRREEFQAACIQAIRDIAAGHNDPRGLAQSIIEKENNHA